MRSRPSSPRLVRVAFLVIPLAVGQGLAGVSMGLFGPPGGADTNLLPPAAFAIAWLCLYPAFGRASLGVFEASPGQARTFALRAGWAFLLFSWGWMPAACAVASPWVTVGLDLVASAVLAAAALFYVRVSRTAGKWLLPAVLWMPTTTVLSLHAALAA